MREENVMSLSEDEHAARALLLGMERVRGSVMIGDHFYVLYRKRLGPGKYVGCALYDYYDAATLEPMKQADYRNRSEVDAPLPRRDDRSMGMLLP